VAQLVSLALLGSAREFHWSYTYTGLLVTQARVLVGIPLLYDLYLFVFDLCISW